MVRQLRGLMVQDALEDIEAEGRGHGDLLDSLEIVTLTMPMPIGNLKSLTGQN
jgi:hypothetical protein